MQEVIEARRGEYEEMMRNVLIQTQAVEELTRRIQNIGLYESSKESDAQFTQRPSYCNTSEQPLSSKSQSQVIPV